MERSPHCNFFGTYKCGLCECDDSHFGRKCECSLQESQNVNQTMQNCKAPNSTQECSGRGNCVCGKCECHTRNKPEEVSEVYFY